MCVYTIFLLQDRLIFGGCRLFDLLEIAVGFVDCFREGERAVVFFQNVLEFHNLMPVDHADQYALLLFAVGSDGGKACDAVTECFENLIGDLVGVGGDDCELAGGFRALDDVVADKAGNEAVEDAQAHRLVIEDKIARAVLLGVYEKGNRGDKGVQRKRNPEEIQLPLFLAYVFGNDVRAAGGGAHAEADTVDEAGNHAAEQDGEDGVVAVGIVLELRKPDFLQQEEGSGIYETEAQRPAGEAFVNQEPGQRTERDVDQEGHVADAETGFVLDHGGNAVQTRRGEIVVDDKQLIIEGQKHGNQRYCEIGKDTVGKTAAVGGKGRACHRKAPHCRKMYGIVCPSRIE